jgi:hypothetical protein
VFKEARRSLGVWDGSQRRLRHIGLIVMQCGKGAVYGESNRAKRGSVVTGGSQEKLRGISIKRSQENLIYIGLKVIQYEKDKAYGSEKPEVFIIAVVITSSLTE